jgi:hypothetical protein
MNLAVDSAARSNVLPQFGETHRLRVFENRVMRRIFGPKRDEVTGEWRKLHNEELRDLNSSLSIIRIIKSRRMRWAGHVARLGEMRNAYRMLVGKPEGKRPLGRPRRRWVDNIRMDIGEVGWGDVISWGSNTHSEVYLRLLNHRVRTSWLIHMQLLYSGKEAHQHNKGRAGTSAV